MKINNQAAACFPPIGTRPELKFQARKETLTSPKVLPETWKSISTHLKSSNVSFDVQERSLAAADKQRGLVRQQQSLRAAQSKFEYAVAGNPLSRADATKSAARGGLDAIREKFEEKTKNLEGQDKLGNFAIQDLMSTYNQAETLASSVRKKLDDTAEAVIGKI
jgi:phage shock protein A